MAVEVAAWNVAKGLGIEERASKVLEGIKRLDADVVILSEAFATDNSTSPDFRSDVFGRVMEFAGANGYQSIDAPAYQDANTDRVGAPDGFEQYLMVLGRNDPMIRSARTLRLGTRNAFSMQVADPKAHKELHIVGAHFDDRSESLRQYMAASLLEKVDLTRPLVLAGDLNAMHRGTISARLVRSKVAEMVAKRLPSERAKWLGQRLVEMGDGGTMDLLADGGLTDADAKHHRTFTFSHVRLGQLDHIMTANVTADQFKVHKLSGSDHRAVSARIRF
jgi:endonuclease/exonuclease/phosphatase family metal-dependent hydrolase